MCLSKFKFFIEIYITNVGMSHWGYGKHNGKYFALIVNPDYSNIVESILIN